MERQFFDIDRKDPLTVDYYLSKLSFQTVGAILRGAEYEKRNETSLLLASVPLDRESQDRI
jgi:hypothetical protein